MVYSAKAFSIDALRLSNLIVVYFLPDDRKRSGDQSGRDYHGSIAICPAIAKDISGCYNHFIPFYSCITVRFAQQTRYPSIQAILS